MFYCDWKFLTDDEKDGMLSYWEKIMQETDDHIFNYLYGPFKESIQGITKGEVDTLWIS
ncbi:MAG TPA: hypothetical protein VK072_09240 [Candidatus Avamphibacillus sp.]|nr:hypothetical protein [Candidatus Avamphibacillus sp.]